jgi:hypothetical protein
MIDTWQSSDMNWIIQSRIHHKTLIDVSNTMKETQIQTLKITEIYLGNYQVAL